MTIMFNQVTRWLALKKYQIEVTFSVYIFTAAEKAIFWSVVFLFSALTMIATIVYLPLHISFILNRAYFYFMGDDGVDVLELTKDAMHELAQGALGTAVTTTTTIVMTERATETLLHSAAVAAAKLEL